LPRIAARGSKAMGNVPSYLSPPEVARRFGVNADKVRTWIHSGELHAVNVAARAAGRPRWRISEADLAKFVAGRSAPPPALRRHRRKDPDVIEFF
jgi:excisionase family DNA binding protein